MTRKSVDPNGVDFHAGSMIRAARKYRGLSQRQLGERIGWKQGRVSDVEGQPHVWTGTLLKIADALDLELGFREVTRGR